MLEYNLQGAVADFLLGGLSAVVTKFAVAPFNRAKIILQLQDELIRQGLLNKPFGGLVGALGHVVHTEGVAGLFRGALCDVIQYFPTQALNFTLKDSLKECFGQSNARTPIFKFITNVLSGGMAGAISLLVVMPLHQANTVLSADLVVPQLGHTEHQYTGMVDVWRQTIKHSGPEGLFSGFGVSVAGIILYRGFYFGLYDSLKPLIHNGREQPSFITSFGFSWAVTITAGLITYPLDTIRRRMMIASASPLAFSGTLDCVCTIWREDGISGFFHGALSNIGRAIAGSLILCLYDAILEQIRPRQPSNPPRQQ